jgi:hypothetical protein
MIAIIFYAYFLNSSTQKYAIDKPSYKEPKGNTNPSAHFNN